MCVSPAVATVTTVVDLLDGTDDGAPSPAGIIVADVYADVSPTGQAWTAGGLRAVAMNGARLRYGHDPNGLQVLTNPGTADRFVTLFSRPRGRNDDARFRNGGVGFAGGYSPGTPSPEATATRLNVAWLASPPPTSGSPPVAGYVVRVAIDVSQITVPGGPFPNSAFRAYRVGEQPAGAAAVLTSMGAQAGDFGTVNATFDAPNVTGLDWASMCRSRGRWG